MLSLSLLLLSENHDISFSICGVGMAIGLFLLAIMVSVLQHQFFWRSMSTGVLVRGSLTSMIYKRGVRLTPEARGTMPNSRLVNFVSSDVSIAKKGITILELIPV